jgi:hypothetical protein
MKMHLRTMIIIAPLFLKGSGKWFFYLTAEDSKTMQN